VLPRKKIGELFDKIFSFTDVRPKRCSSFLNTFKGDRNRKQNNYFEF
jgi:hypothetical protein